MNRCSGVLMPVSALPSRFGIGDFGEKSKEFVDILADSGFHLWQILPLNPLGYGHSPYQPFSSFALDELYADLDSLSAKGLIKKAPSYNEFASKVLYEDIRKFKEPYLKEAFSNEMKKDPNCLNSFVSSHPWVNDWSIFMMNKRRNDLRSWDNWSKEQQAMIEREKPLTAEEKVLSTYEVWLQKTLYEEWDALHSYANSKGIKIVGDVPFYVGYDSCDVWANQGCFLLDKKTKQPLWIAGVPPDYFSATGQRWGNPIYDWDELERRDFSFIINRLKLNGSLYDIIRLDHFRAFDTYWKIPASCPTAIEGSWIEAPGYKFFDTFLRKVPNLEIIAEDLGDLRPEVLTLRDHYNFPGMNVIEFTFFDAEIAHKNGYDRENMVAYLGTHDNQPLKAFYQALPLKDQSEWDRALDIRQFPKGNINERFINYEMSLKAKYAIFALQDILGLGDEARLNKPGIIDDVNWTWRMTDYSSLIGLSKHLKSLNEQYRR
ncbi:MAG: 4-alpha-glucanotransferase [Bacilli bacterium]|nr:4-alpha-glucanotransferase [Bacilli bacterium]